MRNANGKSSRKEELTAPGLPVTSPLARETPVTAKMIAEFGSSPVRHLYQLHLGQELDSGAQQVTRARQGGQPFGSSSGQVHQPGLLTRDKQGSPVP